METKLKVILLNYTPNPDKVVELAAKLCYSPSSIEDLKISDSEHNNFVKKIIEMGHLSPIEHASFTFAVEGISRVCSHQLVRHRLASYSQQSQRYVNLENTFKYIIPPKINEDAELKEKYIDFMKTAQDFYHYLIEKLKKKDENNKHIYEDARFVLPNASETKIIITMNGRELLHFFKQRLCFRAQWEIREMAIEMLKLVKLVAPKIFNNAGPSCLNGKCPEGKFSCGRMKEIQNYFSKYLSTSK